MHRETIEADFVTLAIDRYQSPLIRYAASILGDVERAREVVQDTFLRLCKEKPSKIRNHLAAWLFTVCRNRAFDVRKQERRTNPLTEIDLETRPAPGPRPFAVLEREEELRQVFRLVDALPEKEREVVMLKFQCDLSYKEISAVTGHSVSNVGFLIHTGLKRVRTQVHTSRSRQTPALARRLP